MFKSKTEVAQRAASHLAQAGITDITSTTHDPSVVFNNAWDVAVRSYLAHEDTLWLFATKWAQLPEATNDRTDTWNYAHAMPGDFVKRVTLQDGSTNTYFWLSPAYLAIPTPTIIQPYELNGRTFYSNLEYIRLGYVYHHIDVFSWPDYAQWGFSYWLAFMGCSEITRKREAVREMERVATMKVHAAASIDANQVESGLPVEAAWQTARAHGLGM